MSFKKAKESFSFDLEEIKKAGLWKTERIINSDQKICDQANLAKLS